MPRAAGLKVGAYHFAQPTTTAGDAVAEADCFIDQAAPRSGELRPVLDLERSNGLSQSVALQDWVRAFLGRVYERTGVRGIIYVLAKLLEDVHGRHDLVRDERLRRPVGRPLDDRGRADRPRRGWGAPRLDVLAVHVLRGRGRDVRARSTSTATTATDLRPYLIP